MNNVEKDRFTFYLPLDIISKVRDIKETTGIPHGTIIERALEDYFKKIEKDPSALLFGNKKEE